MATVRPFKGLVYNAEAVRLSEVVAPPYDVISPELQHRLYEKDPRNVVRLILNRDPDPYASAAEAFRTWQSDGTLLRDTEPAFYLLSQSFAGAGGSDITRSGCIGLCRLEEFEKKVILPHEKTLAKPKEDRLKLFQATESNFSQVFGVYADPEKSLSSLFAEATSAPPDLDVTFEGVRNRLWRIQGGRRTRAISDFFENRNILIADGHHRYETALAYRAARRSADPHGSPDAPYNYVMMFLTNMSDEGLVVLPTHRVVHSVQNFDSSALLKMLSASFVLQSFNSPERMMHALQEGGSGTLAMVLREHQAYHVLSLKPGLSASEVVEGPEPDVVKQLDVAVLHFHILRSLLGISAHAQEQKSNLDYVVDPVEAVETVRKGYAQAAFLLNPTPVDQVYAVASAGYTMPQKSTFFFPKLLSGLVFHSHRD